MLCQCGATIPNNVEYCPYCGKRQFIRTRPAKLTSQPIEPYEGEFYEGGSKTGCLGKLLSLIVFVLFFAGLFWFLWKEGQVQFLMEWLSNL